MVCGTIIAALRTNTIQLIFVSFKDHAFGVISKNSSANLDFILCIFLEVIKFSILYLHMIHFELIFVKDVKSVLRFNILHVDIHNHLVK